VEIAARSFAPAEEEVELLMPGSLRPHPLLFDPLLF
jgi:hypothetical protein